MAQIYRLHCASRYFFIKTIYLSKVKAEYTSVYSAFGQLDADDVMLGRALPMLDLADATQIGGRVVAAEDRVALAHGLAGRELLVLVVCGRWRTCGGRQGQHGDLVHAAPVGLELKPFLLDAATEFRVGHQPLAEQAAELELVLDGRLVSRLTGELGVPTQSEVVVLFLGGEKCTELTLNDHVADAVTHLRSPSYKKQRKLEHSLPDTKLQTPPFLT